MTARKRVRIEWEHLPREQLLDLRIRDLSLELEGTWVKACVDELHRELEKRGIALRPHCWLSDEWFSPQNVPGIGIPFYLVHPRLIRLERSMMLEAEGASRAECMRILRHEAGHAMQHGFRLHRRPSYQRLFGKSSTKYPTSYRPKPASRHFVQHLRAYYAQAHPDEDFAETFAVWLQPRARWRKRYEGWGALRKLEYVDVLMAELEGKRPPVKTRERVAPVSQLTSTLRAHYESKREFYAVDFPSTYDRELCRVFSNAPKDARRELASRFIGRHAKEIRALVARWTGESEFTIDQLLQDMIGRSRTLKLRVPESDKKVLLDFAGMLAVRSVHFLYRRRESIPL
ncbi:MAG: putative zinc-binding metallopeptidase [Gemmatimonadaceae bacterium]